jgi:hypothetical protein
MKSSFFLKALLVLTVALVPAALVSKVSWDYLGEANVDGGSDHDRIQVGKSKGQFRRIQIYVERAAVNFDRVEVHYGNGTSYPVRIAGNIPAGGKTREIDLPGDERWIESVEVWYRRGNWSNANKPKIRLMVFGTNS